MRPALLARCTESGRPALMPLCRASAVRPTFEYVVKAQQFYTHRKRLNIDDAFTESWGCFWVGGLSLGDRQESIFNHLSALRESLHSEAIKKAQCR